VGNGRTMRTRDPENVLREIDHFYSKYNFKRLIFTDDDANVNREVFHAVLRGLIERKYDFAIEVFYLAINPLIEETIQLMAEAGMKRITLPIETGSPRMQKEMKKYIKMSKAEESFGWAKKYGLNTETNFIVGYPQETMDDVRQTIDFARKVRAHQTNFFTATPWEGTDLYDYAAENNHLPELTELDVKRGYRDMGHFVNVDFDYAELKQITYDENIRLNFLTHLWLDEPEHHGDLLKIWQNFEVDLSSHAVLSLCLGFLSGKMGNTKEKERYYLRTADLFQMGEVQNAYEKYLHWDEEPILDYLSFCENLKIEVTA